MAAHLDLSHFHECFVHSSIARNLVPRGFEHLSIAGTNARHQALPLGSLSEAVKHEDAVRPDFLGHLRFQPHDACCAGGFYELAVGYSKRIRGRWIQPEPVFWIESIQPGI